MRMEFEEWQCAGRIRGEISFCKCYYDRVLKRRLGYADKVWVGIKEKIEPEEIQMKMAVFDAELFKQWEKIEQGFRYLEKRKIKLFNIYPFHASNWEKDPTMQIKEWGWHVKNLSRVCQKWTKPLLPPLELPSELFEGNRIFGPLTEEMSRLGHPPFLGWRNDRCKALIISENKSYLKNLFKWVNEIFTNPNREKAIFELLKKEFPDLTREEYETLTAYNLGNLYRVFKTFLGFDNPFLDILIQCRKSPVIAHPSLTKKLKKTRRKIWKPLAWLDRPIFTTSRAPSMNIYKSLLKGMYTFKYKDPLLFQSKHRDKILKRRVLLTFLRNIKSRAK